MTIQPYLSFEGRCEEAIEFYRHALGAEVTGLMRYKHSPDPSMVLPGAEDKVMHASLRVGDAVLMACDGGCIGKGGFDGIALALQAADAAEAERLFAALAAGGQVQMPLVETFWSPRFGMVADKFGVSWMVNVAA